MTKYVCDSRRRYHSRNIVKRWKGSFAGLNAHSPFLEHILLKQEARPGIDYSGSGAIDTRLDVGGKEGNILRMSVTLDLDEKALAMVPLQPGERERLMEIELACRFYARGWLSLGQAARMAKLDRFAFGLELAGRDIPRQYNLEDLEADVHYGGGQ